MNEFDLEVFNKEAAVRAELLNSSGWHGWWEKIKVYPHLRKRKKWMRRTVKEIEQRAAGAAKVAMYEVRADHIEEDKRLIEEKYGKIMGDPVLMANGNYRAFVAEWDYTQDRHIRGHASWDA
jgi:hypothetical protein